jgi:hypothetical protein
MFPEMSTWDEIFTPKLSSILSAHFRNFPLDVPEINSEITALELRL